MADPITGQGERNVSDLALSKHARFPGWAPGMPVVRDTGGWNIGEGLVLEIPAHGRYVWIGGLEGDERGVPVWSRVQVFAGDPAPCRFDHDHLAAWGWMRLWRDSAMKRLGLRADPLRPGAVCAWDGTSVVRGEGDTDGERLASLVWQLWDRIDEQEWAIESVIGSPRGPSR